MNIMGLLGQIAFDKIISSGAPVSHKSKAVLGFFALAGFFIFMGFGFLLAGLNQYLTTVYEPHIATFVTGAVCIILALMASLGAYLVLQYKQSRIQKMQNEMMNAVNDIMDFADDELAALIRNNPKMTMALVSIAGLVLGKRFL